ncbi:MAG: zinc-dependent peptidase [Porticoccus sp.]|nr:zinc-dependent peptidase [Porticoccus sp.]
MYFWDDVASGASDFTDGCNVVLHEVSHQLGSLSGSTNGASPLHRNCYSSWAKVLSSEFEKLKWASLRHNKTTMDECGATNQQHSLQLPRKHF